MNTLWQQTIRVSSGLFRGNWPLSDFLPDPRTPFLRVKFAYLRLNTPTPCPPRSAVPVNWGKPYFAPWRVSGKNSVRDATRSMRCGRDFRDSAARRQVKTCSSPLIGSGGVAEMCRMVWNSTRISHKLTVRDASSCVTGKNQRRKECHENEE